MANIPKTKIATSDVLSVCDGLPLFPIDGTDLTFRSGVGGSETLFDFRKTLAGTTGEINGNWSYFFGVCGPAWAVEMTLDGQTVGQDLILTISDDRMLAGLDFGANAGFDFEIDASVWGNTKLAVSFSVDFDMIRIGLSVLQVFLAGLAASITKLTGSFVIAELKGAYGFLAEKDGGFVPGQGTTEVKPVLNLPFNLWPLAVVLDLTTAAFAEVLVAANATLVATLSSIGFGPVLGIIVPVSAKMEKLILDDVEYEDLRFDTNSNTVTGTTTSTPPADPSKLKIEFAQTPNFSFGNGLFAGVTLLAVFNLSFSVFLPIGTILGIEIKVGTFLQSVENTIGQTSVFRTAFDDLELMEVDFV
jgi:hypothetical protein